MYLKLFFEEEDLHFYGLVDDSMSMDFGSPSKFFVARQILAALGYIGLCRGDRVKLSTLSGSGVGTPALRGRASLPRLLGTLESMKPAEVPPMDSCVKNFCLRNSGKGIIVLVTDLMDKSGYDAALRMLVAREMDIYIVHLLSPEEIDPKITGDLKLVDCEDGDAREISVSSHLLKRYQATLSAFIEQAKNYCNRRSIVYIPARSDQAVDVLINQYLRQRGLVR